MRNIYSFTLLFLLLAFCLCSISQAQNGSGDEVLTNESVVTMLKAGLSPNIVSMKIKASKTKFDVTTNELIRLKREQVPDEIINAMVEASSTQSAKIAVTGAGDATRAADPNDPLAPHDAGIYLYEEKDGKRVMVQLEPTISKQSKAGGFLASAVTYGIAKTKVKAALSSSNARLQLDNSKPVFYFYFEVKNSGLSSSNYYATSPNEFALVKFEVKKSSREVVISQANIFSAESGTLDKYTRAFDYEKIAPGVFKVTIRENLDNGEYGFYFGGGAGAGYGAKIFDFGIKLSR